MKTLYTLVTLCFLLVSHCCLAAAPTIPASAVGFTFVDGSSFRIQFTKGNGEKRIVVIKQTDAITGLPANGTDYNANAKFGLGDVLNEGEYVIYDGTSNYADVTNLSPNTHYQVAVFEYNGSNYGTEYLTSSFASAQKNTLAAPTTQASAANFSNINGNSVTISWTSGNGSGRLVVLREGGPVNGNPADLTAYPASAKFGGTSQTSPGNFVVAAGTAGKVDVTNLKPNTSYHVAVFEYNGNSGLVYQTSNPASASFTSLARPTTASSSVSFSASEGNFLRMSFTAGNGNKRLVLVKAGSEPTTLPSDGIEYTANKDVELAPELAPGEKIIYSGNLGYVDASNLQPGTTYFFRMYEYSGDGAQTGYLTATYAAGSKATLSAPTQAAAALSFTNPVGTGITASWTKGNGTSRMLVMRAGAPVSFHPLDLKIYSASSNFGSGSAVAPNEYCVYNSNTSSSNITNLVPGTTYYAALFEFNGSNGPVYLVPGTEASFVLADRPTNPSSNISSNNVEGNGFSLSWTKGNGTNRIVIMRKATDIDAVPQDGVSYTANSNFLLAAEIAAGQKVVYNGSSSNVAVTGLEPATTYYVRIFEYSGSGANTRWLTNQFATANKSTALPPATGASAISFSDITSTGFKLQLTKGNGSYRIILIRENAAVNAVPADLSQYTANTQFGKGAKLGIDNFVLYNSNATAVAVTGCQPGASYHIAVFEYNGLNGPVYNTSDIARANVTTNIRPTQAATAMTFSTIEANGLKVNWTSGNGPLRMLVAREGSAVDAVPADNQLYTANADFTKAAELSAGQKIMYIGSGSSIELNGLHTGKSYYFKVFEYATVGAVTQYLTQSVAEGNKSTAIAPTVQASGIQFTNITGNAFTIGFTKGNGERTLVLLRKNKPVEAIPELYKPYAYTGVFGQGAKFSDDSYAVYFNSQTTANITNLQPGVTYYAAVFDANGSAGPAYLINNPGTAQATTIGAPQDPPGMPEVLDQTSSSVRLRWENGTGQKRVVFVKEGTPVDILPVDNIAYTANSFFTSGQQVGNGNYTVYNGTGKEVIITNLSVGKVYYFAIFDFNQFGSNIMYLTSTYASGHTPLIILPLSIKSFSGERKNDAIALRWITASEANTSHFGIERSSNGQDFSAIGKLAAAGNSNSEKTYQWLDAQASTGKNYYRLKMVDTDGSATYSQVINVSGAGKQSLPVVSFGNGSIRLNWNNYQQPVTIVVVDLQGKIIMRKLVTPGINAIQSSQLPKAMYIVQVQAGKEQAVYKIIN